MPKIFEFGHEVDGYTIRVVNEREARAAAGILLVLGMLSFLNAYLMHDFTFTKIFVTFFMIDFTVRIFINPDFAPSLILGRFFIQNQKPEYVGAPQKRFAWSIGWILSVVMFFLIVVFEIMTPIKIVICLLCLLFLFSESAFGICIGCKLYHLLNRQTHYCPGDVCEVRKKEKITIISKTQAAILLIALAVFGWTTYRALSAQETVSTMKCQSGKPQAGKCGGG